MIPPQYTACVEACMACTVACHHCASACLREKDVNPMARCIALDLDCAAICELATAAMGRDSENARAFCRVCADICETCADECARHGMDHCQACAKACELCARECRQMEVFEALS